MEGAPLSGAELRPDMDKDCSVLFILVDSWKPQLREWDPIEIPQKTGTLEFNIVIKFTDRQQGEARYIPNLSGGVNPGPGPGPGPEDSENTSVRGVDSLTSTAKSGIITVPGEENLSNQAKLGIRPGRLHKSLYHSKDLPESVNRKRSAKSYMRKGQQMLGVIPFTVNSLPSIPTNGVDFNDSLGDYEQKLLTPDRTPSRSDSIDCHFREQALLVDHADRVISTGTIGSSYMPYNMTVSANSSICHMATITETRPGVPAAIGPIGVGFFTTTLSEFLVSKTSPDQVRGITHGWQASINR